MQSLRRPRLGILGLMLELYDRAHPELRPDRAKFGDRLRELCQAFADATFVGPCNRRAQVDAAVRDLEQRGADMIAVVHLSYAPSLIALPALTRTSLPIVLWNTQELRGIDDRFSHEDMLRNHGMHGQQDLANVLVRAGRDFATVTGHCEDERALRELSEWAVAARAFREIQGCRVGLLGHAFPGMGDFGVDETALLAGLGPSVVRIDLDRLAAALASVPDDDVARVVAEDRSSLDVDPALTEEEHRASVRIELALKSVVAEVGLCAIALHYPVLCSDPRFDALPFTGISRLMAEGVAFGGEGDVTSAVAGAIMRQLFGVAGFTEMFTMDPAGGTVFMSHYAEANPTMAREGARIRLVRREGWVGSGGVSTSLAFPLQPGPLTLLNLTTGTDGRLKMIGAEAEAVEFHLAQFDAPHFRLRPRVPLADFLDRYMQVGGTHHLAISPGHGLELVRKFARVANLPFTVV